MRRTLFFLMLWQAARSDEEIILTESKVGDFVDLGTSHKCEENGVVASWCDVTINSKVDCMIHPTLDLYTCTCDDTASCPTECIEKGEVVKKTNHGIQCRGIPQDEANYVLKTNKQKLPKVHHCENNALIANWCNELTVPEVDCLLLPALDEYVCSCRGKPSACPDECIGGEIPDKKTKHGIRCTGIPLDNPNYVLKTKKN